jgi:hypothetical protein
MSETRKLAASWSRILSAIAASPALTEDRTLARVRGCAATSLIQPSPPITAASSIAAISGTLEDENPINMTGAQNYYN